MRVPSRFHPLQPWARYGAAVLLLLNAIAGIEAPVALIDSIERTSRLSWDDADIQDIRDIATQAALVMEPTSEALSVLRLVVSPVRVGLRFEPSPRRDDPTISRRITRSPPAL